jgi:hypothetical protein
MIKSDIMMRQQSAVVATRTMVKVRLTVVVLDGIEGGTSLGCLSPYNCAAGGRQGNPFVGEM